MLSRMVELDIYGIFVSPLLIIALAALLVAAAIRRGLHRMGFYRLVWHPALFDLSLLIILVGALLALSRNWFSS
jgi:protein AaeX